MISLRLAFGGSAVDIEVIKAKEHKILWRKGEKKLFRAGRKYCISCKVTSNSISVGEGLKFSPLSVVLSNYDFLFKM